MKRVFHAVLVVIAMIASVAPTVAQEPRNRDRHEGYYYPAVKSRETYTSRAQELPDSDRQRRLSFVSLLSQQQAERPYPPRYAMFAKGEEAEKFILIGFEGSGINTIYRARALFAAMTNLARLTPLFQELQVDDLFTFFDLLKLLGFTQITVSDGDKFTHQITLK
jgi:hypothetical protein